MIFSILISGISNEIDIEMINENKIRWGIMGLGKIAHAFATALREVDGAELYAVASRNKDKASQFAREYDAHIAYDNYMAMAEDPLLDAVYIATPHGCHKEHAIICLKHRKAVLCEKALGLDTIEVNQMIETAKANNTLLMEAMWTNFLPHFQSAVAAIREGAIGDIVEIKADFGFRSIYDPDSRLMNKSLGGGSLLDIGIYPVFLALTLLGIPEHIQATATFFSTGADSSCEMEFIYANAKALLKCSFLEETPTEAIITGSKGKLTIHSRFHGPSSYSIEKNGSTTHYPIPFSSNGYNYEIDHFNDLIRQGKSESERMTFVKSRELMQILDRVKTQIGLIY